MAWANQRGAWPSLLSSVLVAASICFSSGCSTTGKRVREEIPRLYGTSDPQFERTMGHLLGPQIVPGNRFRAFANGDEIFPAMLGAIAGAHETICFETYIYWSGEIGKKFGEALAERARAGVQVNVLLDWFGSERIDRDTLQTMQDAGVHITRFHKLAWYSVRRLNNRTHRKLLIVDGRIGFTGGVGIADQWTGHAQDADHWRDMHYRVDGPVVSQMQAVFMDNWMEATGQVLHGKLYFPPLRPEGDGAAQMFSSSPAGGEESMKLMYMLAIAAAEHSIYLENAYFVPDPLARGSLVAAVKRGVKVQIITPGKHIDNKVVRRASRARWGDLLAAGVEIYEYQPTMFHCKVMVVDGRFVSVGSTNFDPRSFGLNDEANLNIYDEAFARQQIEVFRRDLSQSRQLTYEQWRERPFMEKLLERTASLVGSEL